jgi:prophage regulatory protein
MTRQHMLRLGAVLDRRGVTRTPHYDDIGRGLMTRPVKTGGQRAAGWPEHEVDAIVAARVAGATDDEVRKLVDRLHAMRATAYRAMLAEVGESNAKAGAR